MSKDRVAKFLEKLSKDKSLRDGVDVDDPQQRFDRVLELAKKHGVELTQDDLVAFLTAGARKLDAPAKGHAHQPAKAKG